MVAKGHRTEAGDQTRSAILQATITLLGRDGPDGFTASALAKEASISKATLFHHFRAVDEIPLIAFQEHWLRSLSPNTQKPASARDYIDQLGKQVIELARKRESLLKAQAVFLTKAIFDDRLRNGVVSSALQMHETLVRELSSRLPPTLQPTEVNAIARIAEMMLDGLMIALLMRESPKRIAELRQIWMRFVDLLLSGAGNV